MCVWVVLFWSFKYSIPDAFGLSKFDRILLLETTSEKLTPSSKSGHLKMSDPEIVDCVLEADGSKIDVLQVYDKIISFNS